MAAVGHSAPESPDGYWRSKLNAIRELAMARPKPQGQKIAVLKPGVVTAIKPAAEPAPQPTKQAEVVVNLTSTFNKHLKTRITFQANGWNIWASAGLNPDNPDGDYLILQVEDKASIVFDIRSMITLTEQLKAFGVNGVPMVLVGEGVVKWGNPERDSTLGVAVNINNDPDPSVRLKEPKIGKEPNYLLKPFTMDDFRKALWDAGTPVQVGAEEIRFYYGDQVSKGERRLQTGPGKGFAFIRKFPDGKFSHAVLLNDDKVPAGGSVTIALAKDLVLRLVRDDQNNLKITKENSK